MQKVVVLLLGIAFSALSFASDIIELQWQALNSAAKDAPKVTFPELSDTQIAQLRTILDLRESEDSADIARVKSIKADMASAGLDADELLDLREQYMSSRKAEEWTLNTEYDGKRIRLPGFLVPLEYSDDLKATEFLLVPYAGACIHMPPPPANQIVRVVYPEGYEVLNINAPVWVEGELASNLQTQNIFVVDGNRDVTMGYSLSATLVEDY